MIKRDMFGGWASEGSERYSRTAKYKIELMQHAVSKTFKSLEHDPVAEADDLDALGTLSKSWDVPDEETLRTKTKTLLVSQTFLDVPRDDFPDSAAPPVDLVPGGFVPDESLDEALAAKEKLSGLQQVWNRGRSESGTRILHVVFWQEEDQSVAPDWANALCSLASTL